MRKSYNLLGIYTLMVIALTIMAFSKCANSCSSEKVVRDTVYTERWDTVHTEIRDTVPQYISETVIRYVKLPAEAPSDTMSGDDTADSLPVVQRVYTDDSTYTAYVSGIKFDDLPKLDSIMTRQREISHTIKETITVKQKYKPRFTFGLQAGMGYGFFSGKVEPYVGFGAQMNF